MGYKGRDVEVCLLENDLCLIVACDSCGAVGEKDLDQVLPYHSQGIAFIVWACQKSDRKFWMQVHWKL
ncbi:hypothetical protein [Desulfobacula sp.]|uniref:hypothetical protein n=1 Tax=Desulfobacula sp. TaxID=2593537 RepID=UPI0026369023|nr:hypothetical protein [Desulfobacula sp.]